MVIRKILELIVVLVPITAIWFVLVIFTASVTEGVITSKIGISEIVWTAWTATEDTELHAIIIAFTFLDSKK